MRYIKAEVKQVSSIPTLNHDPIWPFQLHGDLNDISSSLTTSTPWNLLVPQLVPQLLLRRWTLPLCVQVTAMPATAAMPSQGHPVWARLKLWKCSLNWECNPVKEALCYMVNTHSDHSECRTQENITTAQRQEEENKIEPEKENPEQGRITKQRMVVSSQRDQNTVTGIAVVSSWGLSMWMLRRFFFASNSLHTWIFIKSHISCSAKCILFWFGFFLLFGNWKEPNNLSKNEVIVLSPKPSLSRSLPVSILDITIPTLWFLPRPYQSVNPPANFSQFYLHNTAQEIRVGKYSAHSMTAQPFTLQQTSLNDHCALSPSPKQG